MDIFISWSGSRSQLLAEQLRAWLPRVIQVVKPWMSSEDAPKGSRWSMEIESRLKAASFGIVCVTPENLSSPWLHFEAGAISNAIGSARVAPLLLGLRPAEVTGPLAQFQLTAVDVSGDVLLLVKSINDARGEERLPEDRLIEAFNKWLPDFEDSVAEVRAQRESISAESRSERELLEEILVVSRGLERQWAESQPVIREPSRDSVTRAWGDNVLRNLSGKAKAYLGSGRFVGIDGYTVVFAVPNEQWPARSMDVREEAEQALSAYFNQPIRIRLIVENTAAP